jgi:hypothetical protein
MVMIKDVAELFIEPMVRIWGVFVSYMPNIIAALIFLLVGLFLARLLSSIAEQFLRRIKLDTYTSRVGINEMMARLGFGKSMTVIVGFIIYWALILVFFVSAADILNLTAIAQILESILTVFIPRIAAGILIAFGGLLFARFMSDVVLRSAAANNLRGGKSLSKIVNFVILVFAAIAAIEQMGVEMKIIRSSINILFASVGLAFAIAVGLGAKDIVGEIIRGMFTESREEK